MDLSTLSLTQLRKVEAQLPAAMKAAHEREVEKVRAAVDRALDGTGFTLETIYGKPTKTGKARKARAPMAPKYAHPKTGKTWTGQGRTPNWMPKKREDWKSVAI